MHKTDQKKPVKIGPSGMIEDGTPDFGHQDYEVDPQPPASLQDNFNRMQIRSPINNTHQATREEEKRVLPSGGGGGAARILPMAMQEPPRYSNASNLNQ